MRAVFVSALLAFASVVFVVSSPEVARADAGAEASVPAAEIDDARADIEAIVAQMSAASIGVRDQLRAARRHGKKAQIACVDEALSRADVAVRRARAAGDEALDAYGRHDVRAARESLRLVRAIRASQRAFVAEQRRCGAPPAAPRSAVANVTTVKLEIDPTIPTAP